MNSPVIKQELLQYTARLIENHPLQSHENPKAARHDVAALLTEHALELALADDHYDLFIAKPIFKAVLKLIKQQECKLDEIYKEDIRLKRLKEEYLQTIKTLEKILENLK